LKPIAPLVLLLLLLPASLVAKDREAQQCIPQTAEYFGVPPVLLEVVLELEGGTTGEVVRHANGAMDLGAAQINVRHLRKLARLGVSPAAVIGNACVNLAVAAWHLRGDFDRCIHSQSASRCWAQSLLDYHSRSPAHRESYRQRAYQALREKMHDNHR
jgi:hypothetical protein